MLYNLLYPLSDFVSFFNVFRYITFRAAMASVTSFLLCIFVGPYCIKQLKKINLIASNQREHAEQLNNLKVGKEKTPSMGGLLIVLSVVVSTLLWGDIQNNHIILLLVVLVSLSFVGFLDDYLKISNMNNSKGLAARTKLVGQILVGLFLGIFLYQDMSYDKSLVFPFLKSYSIYLGYFSVLFTSLVVVGSSNALNLTDGLDGLAIGCSLFTVASFAIIAYITGNYFFSDYLNVPFIRGTGEISVFCAALLGSGVGFLWFNAYPAEVFMGDTGSLSLGGVIGCVAILIKQELLLVIVGGVYVLEAVSVIIQVFYYKLTGKRFFLMAPFHHHLQLKGWPESKIIIRLWIISFILAMVGLSTLKIR